MTNNDNAIDIKRSTDGVLHIGIPTTLDSVNVPKLKGICITALTDEVSEVQVKLTKTTFMDSAGIGLLVSIYRATKTRQLPMCLIGVSGQPLSLLRSLQIDKAISLK